MVRAGGDVAKSNTGEGNRTKINQVHIGGSRVGCRQFWSIRTKPLPYQHNHELLQSPDFITNHMKIHTYTECKGKAYRRASYISTLILWGYISRPFKLNREAPIPDHNSVWKLLVGRLLQTLVAGWL